MVYEETGKISVTRFVLAGIAVKMLLMAAMAGYTFYNPEADLGNVSTPANILAIGVGLYWYSKSVNRPMTVNEIWRFAFGTVFADLIMSLAWAALVTGVSNQPLTIEGIENAVFDGTPMLSDSNNLGAVLIIIIFTMIMTLALAAFLAWQTTKRLPRAKP